MNAPLAAGGTSAADRRSRPHPDFGRAERLEVFEVLCDGGGFLLRVREDADIEPELGIGFAGQKEERGALDACAEIEDVVFCHAPM